MTTVFFARDGMLLRSFDVGTVNLALCDFSPVDNRIHRWEVFGAASIYKLFDELHKRPFTGHVVIEAQSKKSVKMMAVQNWLHAFYVLKG